MVQSLDPTILPPPFPNHTQLPESDGTFVKNFQEHAQCILLTDSRSTTLQNLHPDGQYAIGQDSGIYWRETDPTERTDAETVRADREQQQKERLAAYLRSQGIDPDLI